MDFVAIKLFIQQVFHLPCFCNCFGYLRLLLFRIKREPGIAYKNVAYKRACTVVLQYSKITYPHYAAFHWDDIVRKCYQK